jgi:hypothetical protein
MEIVEIVSYFLNETKRVLEVSFRSLNDSEDMVRTDKIDYSIVEEYGYDLITEDFDLFGESDDDDDDYNGSDEVELDSDELISFLNEYYLVNPDKMPDSEFY